ncbi:hypothetical protein ACFX13_027228 [Malus domestica]
MPSPQQVLIFLVSKLTLSFDSPILGVALGYAAVRTLLKLSSYSSVLPKVRIAPSVQISDLRSSLAFDQSDQSTAKLAVFRGTVEAKSALDDSKWNIFKKSDVLVSRGTTDRAVIVRRTQTCVFNEWMGLFGWWDFRAYWRALWRALTDPGSSSLRKVPLILVEGGGRGKKPISDFVVVNVHRSRQPLPLTTVYRRLHPVIAPPSPISFFEALYGRDECQGGVLEEEEILRLGKEISAIGLYSFKNGVLEVKSCKDLPYFLSGMSKEQMVVDLALRTKKLFRSGIVLGSMSIGLLGYSAVRIWNRWKAWKQQRQLQQSIRASENKAETQVQEVDAEDDVPRHQLCAVCLTSRRQNAFLPCGHLLCCQPCSVLMKNHVSPKCPLCRKEILVLVRIYES